MTEISYPPPSFTIFFVRLLTEATENDGEPGMTVVNTVFE